MRPVSPISQVEELFTQAAAASLPVNEANIDRTAHGFLCYFWQSPCEALGGLRAYIRDHEIMLSTNISHQHVEIRDFVERDAPNEDPLKNMVESAIRKIFAILNGDVVFTRSYDTAGQQTSCGSGPRDVVIEDLRAKIPTERAWDWNGEISVK